MDVRRALSYLVTLWVVLTLNFLLPRLLPGDPLDALFDRDRAGYVADEAVRSRLAAYYGLDRPLARVLALAPAPVPETIPEPVQVPERAPTREPDREPHLRRRRQPFGIDERPEVAVDEPVQIITVPELSLSSPAFI